MAEKIIMGNQAVALGAINAGVNVVCGYPGTPSTEILETVAKNNQDKQIYVEWSVNEKAAMEVAAGAAYSGARVLVTMKQVGLNVASDPLMSLSYVGIKGGMVIACADDPGPISSQTEQDTRNFAQFAKVPVFDPSSPEEAYEMIGEAFDYSEKYQMPVFFRPTTRVCHACVSLDTGKAEKKIHVPDGFEKDTFRWVIFPRTSYLNHIKLFKRETILAEEFSNYKRNIVSGSKTAKIGFASGGVSWAYLNEALGGCTDEYKLFKVSTPYPFPAKKALEFLDGLDEVAVFEELDPVIEKNLIFLCGQKGIKLTVHGKLDGTTAPAGENSTESIAAVLSKFVNIKPAEAEMPKPPELPVRPPVLCAGCPHRASFFAVKEAMKGKKAVFSGDIGCYTLGNAKPLDMVDTCLCMGADITIAQGIHRVDPDTVNFSFIGDSTFFASGMTGIVNAVYNQTDIVLIVLDNSTTAMTGHQPHPGTGHTMMGDISQSVSIEKILNAVGLASVVTVNPFDIPAAVNAVRDAAGLKGVKAVIFKSPCIAVSKPEKAYEINAEKCINCKKCIRSMGCPAIVLENSKPVIEKSLCFGCGLCSQICPAKAIVRGDK